jgi:hypothetical protein
MQNFIRLVITTINYTIQDSVFKHINQLDVDEQSRKRVEEGRSWESMIIGMAMIAYEIQFG